MARGAALMWSEVSGGPHGTCAATPFKPSNRPQTLRSGHSAFETRVSRRSALLARSFVVSSSIRRRAETVISSAEPTQQQHCTTGTRTAMGRPPGRSLVVTRTVEAAQSLEAPTASLSRVIYSTVQPARIARTAGSGSSRTGSPFSAIIPSMFVLAVTVGTAAAAAFRARMRAVRECRACHGYGVQRCKLCSGKGTIEWEGKMAHREPCPMCLGKRMNACTCCGGGPLITRNLFAHTHRSGADAPESFLAGDGTASASRSYLGQSRLGAMIRRLRRSGPEEEENRIEQSDQFKEQIMMD